MADWDLIMQRNMEKREQERKDKHKQSHKLYRGQLEDIFTKIDDYFENCSKYGLEPREGQHNMALSVYEAIENLDHLIIEAGVGIGKSYAYLIPLMYYFYLTNKSFIVSTSTITLQEQLEKDIKKLSTQLNIPIELVIAKGMGNFICLNRLEQYLKATKNDDNFPEEYFVNHQDRKDYPGVKDNLWKRVNVELCTYSKCQNCNKCEFYKRREKMRTINGVVICNHDLLLEDLSRNDGIYAGGRNLLKNVDFIVCDEAHNLESKVRSWKTREIRINSIKEPLKKAIEILTKNHNYNHDLDEAMNLVEKLSNHINNNVEKQIADLKAKNIEIEDCNGLALLFDDEMTNLSSLILNMIDEINTSVQIVSSGKESDELEEELYEKCDMFRQLAIGSEGNYLFWIERKGKYNNIFYAPKNIDEIAYKLFFEEDYYVTMFSTSKKTFIFTSATLSIGKNDFSYFKHNIGADRVKEGLDVAESYDSPYNYDENALLYCCSDIESPNRNRDKYLKDIVDKIRELILITNGKTLVLFTSKNDMNYVYEQIGKTLNGINVFIQNDGSSQDTVKELFRNDINSVLFSTGIFWEGIDIKGMSLSNLIITRLPFPVVDPIMEYKKSLYGEKGFSKVYLPEMLIKLKQGVGRLIRSETDKGIVCILDSRLKSNTNYEEAVKKTLPIKNFVYDIEEVKNFVYKNKIK